MKGRENFMLATATKKTTDRTLLPITKPVFDNSELQAVSEVLRSGWIVQGPKVAQFESLFAEFVQAEHAIATTSCTSALHLALLAAGIGRGDTVLVPAFTFVATANAVEYASARPVFVDIDLDTLTIDCTQLYQYLNSRARLDTHWPHCVVPVSLFGLCADMETINRLAEGFDLKVVEDAACALGAERESHHAGTEAIAGCFSLHPRKAITTGEGGMIVTRDAQIADTLRKLRDHGASKTDLERHMAQGGSLLPNYDILGFNYRMTDIQGALGVTQMAKLESILDGRQAAAQRYSKLLRNQRVLRPQTVPGGYHHAYQSYVCLFVPEGYDALHQAINRSDWQRIEQWNKHRNLLMAHLESQGISVRQGTHAVHTLGYYQRKYGLRPADFPNAFAADRLSVTLPLYHDMTPSDQQRVTDEISSFLQDAEL